MMPGIQLWLREMGESGCYALSIIEAGKPGITPGNAIAILMSACSEGVVTYNPDRRDNNGFVNRPDILMGLAAGGKWIVEKVYDLSYMAKPGQKVIKYYEWDKGPKGISGHFVADNFDPWGQSETVKRGKLKSLRVFSRVV